MSSCPSCGGVIGRDCFNPQECAQITQSMQQQTDVQPYIDALIEARKCIQWYEDVMPYDEQVQSDRFHMYVGALTVIDNLLPQPKISNTDDLPF